MKATSRMAGLFLGLALFAGTVFAEVPKSYYLIGNSLTWDTIPSRLDGDVQWHVDCGKSLKYISENPDQPCVKASTIWAKALEKKQYAYLSMQPFYGTTLEEDVAVMSEWIKMQPKAVVVIHTGWSHHENRKEQYENKEPPVKMTHHRAYFQKLESSLKAAFPERTFRQTRCIELLATIAADIDAGTAPLEKVADLHRDAIHMKHDSGKYLMHNAMRKALGQPNSEKGFEKLDPHLKTYLDSVLERTLK